jgi:hypothetical protein
MIDKIVRNILTLGTISTTNILTSGRPRVFMEVLNSASNYYVDIKNVTDEALIKRQINFTLKNNLTLKSTKQYFADRFIRFAVTYLRKMILQRKILMHMILCFCK